MHNLAAGLFGLTEWQRLAAWPVTCLFGKLALCCGDESLTFCHQSLGD
jgi:hypothetical protein